MNPHPPCPAAGRHERNNCPGRGPGPQPSRPRPARAAAVITVLAAVALLAVACSGSPSSTGSGGSPNAGESASATLAVRYTSCMRSHGVANYPGPNSSGQIPKITPVNEQQLGISDARFNAAQTACQRLWPYQAPTQAEQGQQLTEYLKFARCMRSHGVPGFPDPSVGRGGRVAFPISISKDGFNPHSPEILAKAHACKHVLPAGPGLPEVTVSP
jgi:hypothetical protein